MNFPRLFVFFLLLLGLLPQLDAQVGNNNPTGVSGIFNGNVTTGCSYDPYTGNAHRTITDIVVAGAVGEYPLALSRTSNSRNVVWSSPFGQPGAWRHNYQWFLQNSAGVTTWGSPPPYYQPPGYSVVFPDGRTETFTDTGGSDPYFRSTAGVRDRFQQLTAGTDLCYLLLPDGGKVEFKATVVSELGYNGDPNLYWNEYVAQAIIDPYGLRTTFTYDTNSPPRLSKVTEPAGRYLQFYYRTFTGQTNIVDKVTASDGRIVQYTYTTSTFPPGTTSYTALTSVTYYGTWTARYTYKSPNNAGNASGVPLLLTADDPMYSGPMKRIAYQYKPATPNNPDGTAPVYGQILSERYWDGVAGHEATGAAVSTLTVGATSNSNIRTETRGDNATRTFIYMFTGYVTWVSDFMWHQSSQAYDENKYVSWVINFNRAPQTDFIRDALNGNMTWTTFPLTAGDTPGQPARPTIHYAYGWGGCADSNNQDWSIPYYVCTATDEAGHVTQFWRDTNKRITQIDYPDGGYETFAYNSFGQVLTHRMTTGGTEIFSYDSTNGYVMSTYRNPSNITGNQTARYQYDAYDRVSGVTDALGSTSGDVNHTTSFEYNLRGQLTKTTLPTDPVDGVRHTIITNYNLDGTPYARIDQINQVTTYEYDDYKRLKSMTTPLRFAGDTTPRTTYFYYDTTGAGDDYKYADSKVTYVTLPSGKRIKAVYDDNRRKISVTTGFNTADAATTGYTYDNVGNLTKVTQPLTSHTTTTVYDERNRPSSINDMGQITTLKYDLSGRKLSVTRPNGQLTTFNSYDAMNRLLQQTATQTPEPNAVTKYTYTQAGLLATMQDPRLVAANSSENYGYLYDSTGRKTWATYPGTTATEQFTYDTAGRLATFKNRNGNVQTFTYDALHRMTGFSWNDGLTPSVTFGYDIGSRLITINNANATISRTYFNDNLLRAETETITGVPRTVNYGYDGDGNRASLEFSGYSFSYDYTGRNQLKNIMSGATTVATYSYDLDGNLISRSLDNSTNTTYGYDELDRVTSVAHALNGTPRTFAYDYDNVGNRKWAKRDGGTGDVFGYDYADQVTAVKLDIPSPEATEPGSQTIVYDANGNRTSFSPYGTTDTYTINDLSQYTSRDTINAAYNNDGDLTTGVDGSIYTYDAQNRLLTASKDGVTYTFTYDGLNRQVTRKLGVNGPTRYSVWDGWDLVQEYQGTTEIGAYLYGPSGLVKNLLSGNYYYQDGSGSTSHLASSGGALLEWYRYDLQGTPIFYNAANTQIPSTNYGIRHLFTGQQWFSQLGLYDLRNRFYSPDIGRFLQPDPVGFAGDATSLYRYCGNNPVTSSDPTGMASGGIDGNKINPTDGEAQVPEVKVPGTFPGSELTSMGGGNEWREARGGYFGTFSSMSGGSSTLVGGGGRFNIRLRHDPSQLGLSPGAPFSTQGQWTNLDGLPTGSAWVVEVLPDEKLLRVLSSVYKNVFADKLQDMTPSQWVAYMRTLNIPEFYNTKLFSYQGVLQILHGVFSGHEINYIGIGMGFAARGGSWDIPQMDLIK